MKTHIFCHLQAPEQKSTCVPDLCWDPGEYKTQVRIRPLVHRAQINVDLATVVNLQFFSSKSLVGCVPRASPSRVFSSQLFLSFSKRFLLSLNLDIAKGQPVPPPSTGLLYPVVACRSAVLPGPASGGPRWRRLAAVTVQTHRSEIVLASGPAGHKAQRGLWGVGTKQFGRGREQSLPNTGSLEEPIHAQAS